VGIKKKTGWLIVYILKFEDHDGFENKVRSARKNRAILNLYGESGRNSIDLEKRLLPYCTSKKISREVGVIEITQKKNSEERAKRRYAIKTT